MDVGSSNHGAKPSEYVHVHVEDADDRFSVMLGLDGLGLVRIVFYGPGYPRCEVS